MSPEWPLETERLFLRPYEERDFDLLHRLQSDPEVVKWLYNDTRDESQTRTLLARKLAGAELREEGDWLACAVDADGEPVGDVSFRWVSKEHRTGEIGFMFDPRCQGQGYATEAARAIVGWAFAAGFHRVIGRTEVRNVPSARVLEKLGMRLEAHLVENEWVKDEWQSELQYAILEREWGG
jgi:RimJ/RimL family protein N-acetyltransferase